MAVIMVIARSVFTIVVAAVVVVVVVVNPIQYM